VKTAFFTAEKRQAAKGFPLRYSTLHPGRRRYRKLLQIHEDSIRQPRLRWIMEAA